MIEKYKLVCIYNYSELIDELLSGLMDKFTVKSMNCINGELGLSLDIYQPDMVLYHLEQEKNYTLFTSLCRKGRYNDIPFIILSSSVTSSDKIEGLNKGALDVIQIPCNVPELTAKLFSLIRFREKCLESMSFRIENEVIKSLENLNNEREYKHFYNDNMYLKYGITIREREIIDLLCKGLLNKEISDTLNVSKRTVEFHINNIYSKFNVKNRMELLHKLK